MRSPMSMVSLPEFPKKLRSTPVIRYEVTRFAEGSDVLRLVKSSIVSLGKDLLVEIH